MLSKRKSRLPVVIRLFCLAFLLIPLTGFAGFKVSGRIINADDGKPVTNATVFLNHSLISATTNTGGFFILKNVRWGQYALFDHTGVWVDHRQQKNKNAGSNEMERDTVS